MRRWALLSLVVAGMFCGLVNAVEAREPDAVIDIWPGMAPGETTKNTGKNCLDGRMKIRRQPALKILRDRSCFSISHRRANGTGRQC